MSKIAILGSSVDNFLKSHYELNMISKIVHEGINLRISKEDVILSTGQHGVPNMALNFPKCSKRIYLPTEPGIFCKDWADEERFQFGYQLGSADTVTITNSDIDGMGHVLKMLNDADSVISFWVGERIGNTFEQMLLANNLGLTIFHGMENAEITHDVLMGGWEPQK